MTGIKYILSILIVFIWFNGLRAHGDAHILIQELTDQLQSDPDNPELYFNRAVLYQSHNDFNASFLDYQIVIELNPDFDPVNLKLSELCLSNELDKMAFLYAEKYLANRGQDAKAWVNRGKVYRFMGEYELAKQDYITALGQVNINPEYFYDLCDIILENDASGQELAISYMRQAQMQIGDVTGFRERIIELELDRGNTENALVELDLLIEKSARKEKWYVQKGDILWKDGKKGEAQRAYIEAKEAINKLPNARKNTDYIQELQSKINVALLE